MELVSQGSLWTLPALASMDGSELEESVSLMDAEDLRAAVNIMGWSVLAGFLLVAVSFTAGVAAGLAVQGFELVR